VIAGAVRRGTIHAVAYPFKIDLLLAGRDFNNGQILQRSREISTTDVPVQNKGGRLAEILNIQYLYMTTKWLYNYCERELNVPLAVTVSYHAGDRDKIGEVDRDNVTCGLEDLWVVLR
jgi:hypothetical protein